MAIVGMGVMGRDHLKNALALQREGVVRLVGLSDVEAERARGPAEEHSLPAFTDHEALLDAAKPEFIAVATPHPSHEAVTVAAAKRGIHVLCEKPITPTVAAADRMIAACRRAGVLLGIDFNQRTTPAYIKARELIAGGEIGELYRVNFIASGWYRTQAYYDSGGWRGTWAGEGGGVIMNQAPHHLDLYCWLAGLPERVKATALTRTHQIEVENTVAALLEFGRERVDTFYTTTAEWPGRTEFLFSGQRGRLIVADRQLRLYRMEQSLSDQAVRSGREEDLVATGEDGRRALELANAMLLSSFRDQTVPIPVDRAAYDVLLAELVQKAERGEFGKRQRGGAKEQVLGALPEGS
jgi:predicted dehydrogenase